MSKQTPTLHEVLQKCSKSELIDVILRAQRLTYSTFPWIELISESRLNVTEKMVDENLSELKKLNEKLKSIPVEQRIISNDEARNTMIALRDNNTRYFKLQRKYDEIFHELYGE